MTRYRTIAADPPWPYDVTDGGMLRSSERHRPNVSRHRVVGVGYAGHYRAMSLPTLAAMPIRDVSDDNAHLYLWTTNAFMVQAHDLARAWGFTPKTILTWGKVHQKDRARPSMKTGYWFRGATEHIVFGVRGSLRLAGTWPTLFLWPRIGRHSVKPEAFYDMVEQASPGPYLEVFARPPHRLGWDVWGNESANTASMEEQTA